MRATAGNDDRRRGDGLNASGRVGRLRTRFSAGGFAASKGSLGNFYEETFEIKIGWFIPNPLTPFSFGDRLDPGNGKNESQMKPTDRDEA
jgi:hypothetical protein